MKRWVSAAIIMATTVAAVPVSAAGGTSRTDVQVVRLECALRTADDDAGEPVVHCRWSEPRVPPASAVKLWRLADPGSGEARQVVYRSDDLAVQEFTDVSVRRGHVYLYAVQLLDENGRIVGRSRVEVVRIPARPGVEVIELGCEIATGGEHVHCRWAAPTVAGAATVALWRSVDGRARQLVASFPADGQTAYRDPVPAGASRIVYAVIVTNDDGHIVGRSRPAKLALPAGGPATDTRPPETRPPETRPPETRPTDAAPADSRPTDARPADTRPVVTAADDTAPTERQPVPVTTVAAERSSGERGGP